MSLNIRYIIHWFCSDDNVRERDGGWQRGGASTQALSILLVSVDTDYIKVISVVSADDSFPPQDPEVGPHLQFYEASQKQIIESGHWSKSVLSPLPSPSPSPTPPIKQG